MTEILPYPTLYDASQLADPVARFQRWLAEAKTRADILEPTAMTLATASATALPSARIVLLKEADAAGFVWYTNGESRKGTELRANPHAALCFHWMPMRKQVRVEGMVTPVPDEEADGYFAHRPRDSQIGAWASQQSRLLDTRATFEARIAEYTEKFSGAASVPRPPHWYGWRLVPERIEFWTERPYRLHDRELYLREEERWVMLRLYP